MADATVGIQSQLDVNASPTVGSQVSSPATWTWIWFVLAVLVIAGFHIRVFGHPIPPASNFP
jgi:hypothetical protein